MSAKIKIYYPSSGNYADVEVDYVGTYLSHGWVIPEGKKAPFSEKEGLTVAQIKDILDKRGVPYSKSAKKDDLLALLNVEDDEDDDSDDEDDNEDGEADDSDEDDEDADEDDG